MKVQTAIQVQKVVLVENLGQVILVDILLQTARERENHLQVKVLVSPEAVPEVVALVVQEVVALAVPVAELLGVAALVLAEVVHEAAVLVMRQQVKHQ